MANLKLFYVSKVDWIKRNGQEKRLPDLDFSPRQLFWIGFARVWCVTYSDIALHIAVRRRVHSPGEFRVRGVVQNSHEFSKDFNCSINSTMNSRTKCEVWQDKNHSGMLASNNNNAKLSNTVTYFKRHMGNITNSYGSCLFKK